MIHYLFLGHFEHDGEVVRFAKGPSESAYRPVICHPVDQAAIKAVLKEVTGAEAEDPAFPEGWMIWLDDGYLVCDKYTRNREAIAFVARLVERTHCEIHDVAAHCNIAVSDWLETTRRHPEPSRIV